VTAISEAGGATVSGRGRGVAKQEELVPQGADFWTFLHTVLQSARWISAGAVMQARGRSKRECGDALGATALTILQRQGS